MQKYLVSTEDGAHKFWSIVLDGAAFTVTYGKVGTAGQAKEKSFASSAEAEKEATKLLNSKLKKGYAEAQEPTSVVADKPAGKSEPKQAVAKKEKPASVSKQALQPLQDVMDDGTVQEWHSDDFWRYFFYNEERFADLKNPKRHKAGNADKNDKYIQPIPQNVSQVIPEKQEYDKKWQASISYNLSRSTSKGSGFMPVFEKLQAAALPAQVFQRIINTALTVLFTDELWDLRKEHIESLKTLLQAGADITTVQQDDPHAFFEHFYKEYSANPDVTQIDMIIAAYFTTVFTQVAASTMALLQTLVQDIQKGGSTFPDKKLPAHICGLELDVDCTIRIYSAGEREKYASEKVEGLKDMQELFIQTHVKPFLQPLLAKMLADGAFDAICNDYFRISFYREPEALIEKRVNEKGLQEQYLQLEKDLTALEQSEDWVHNAQEVTRVLTLYLEHNGIVVNRDNNRILQVILKNMYCGEEAAEKSALNILHAYDHVAEYAQWTYEFVLYQWENFDYTWCITRMKYLVENYEYAPARQKLKEWGSAGNDDTDDDDDDNDEKTAEQKFAEQFTEQDLFVETDTIIARAFSGGNIYIRFKTEGEQGYSHALDFLNNLMTKDYSCIHDGYSLSVRFLAQPLFIVGCADFPCNESHAFFSQAVQYQGLHDKVRFFVDHTMRMYDRYKDLDGEFSTVAGTFAAVALALADMKHLDMAVKFARATDGEHEELARLFTDTLITAYGVRKEIVPAVYELILSWDHAGAGLEKEFYTQPDVVEAVLKHYASTRDRYREHKFIRFVECILPKGKAKAKLKTIKKYFDGAQDTAVKEIYANFYNTYIAAVLEDDSDEDVGTLLALEVEAKTVPLVSNEAFVENPPCIVTLQEAETRGVKIAELEPEELAGAYIFGTVVITDPAIFDCFEKSRAQLFDIKPTCWIAWNPAPSLFGKWVIDVVGAPYQFGIALYDGKNKPVILYGLLDYAAIAVKFDKRSLKNATNLEEVRLATMQMNCPKGSPVMPEGYALQQLDDAKTAWYAEKYMRAVIKVNRLKPEDGDIYLAGLLLKAKLMERKKDAAAIKAAYAELLQRLPEHKEYWEQALKKAGLVS